MKRDGKLSFRVAINIFSMKILITRPEPAASELAEHCIQSKIDTTRLPLLEVRPLKDSLGSTDFHPAAALIFVSQNAVHTFPLSTADTLCFAVGKTTAMSLKQAGFKNIIYPKQGEGAEALLALPELTQVKNRQFEIIRGTQGRDVLEKTLSARGAIVRNRITYTSILREMTPVDLAHITRPYDLVIVTSSHVLRHLAQIGALYYPPIFTTPVTVLAGTMLESALALGFTQPVLVPSFQNQDLYECIRYTKSNLNPC